MNIDAIAQMMRRTVFIGLLHKTKYGRNVQIKRQIVQITRNVAFNQIK